MIATAHTGRGVAGGTKPEGQRRTRDSNSRVVAPTRFPTVVVGWRGVCSGVHLGSWQVGRGSGFRLRSCLNGRERC